MRRRLRLLHLAVALVAGLFVVTLGVTGAVMAFEQELAHALDHGLWHVEPGPAPMTLGAIAASVGAAYPGRPVSRFDVSEQPDLAYRVALPDRLLYVDQYTGRIIGEGEQAPPLLTWVHQLHLRLAWMSHPAAGKAIVSWMSVALLFLLASGLYLWWPLKRFSVAWRASRRRRWLDVHASTGIAVFVFLLVAGLSGAAIGFDGVAEPAFYRLTGSTPIARQPRVLVPAGRDVIGPDRAMAIAREALPGATPFQLALAAPDRPWTVRMRFPEDLTPGGRSRVEIDPYSGEVLAAESSRTAPAGARAVILTRAVHTGDVFGWPSRLLMALASALTAVMATSGLLTWWTRVRRPNPITR
ncbi:MAG: PepSY-associated TM helix domain-containing protein [Vicinamibacterales bacterium]